MLRRPLPFADPVYVTQPMLPPLDEYVAELTSVWNSRWLTNIGDQHRELERLLTQYLRAPHLSLFSNGTLALVVACKALKLHGEVITTPFTFPATPHALTWNGITPVFCDIDPETMALDPQGVEALITERTSGILGVHVYGLPCDVLALRQIATSYGLAEIYDAAHAFGTEIDGEPISTFGDATVFSFHATKLFHTAEGGAVAVRDPAVKAQIDLLKNFGIQNEIDVKLPGINAKMNEIQAALGIVNLRHLDQERRARAEVAAVYYDRLSDVEGLSLVRIPGSVRPSMQYFVVRINAARCGITRDQVYEQLREFNVFARRYFYPLCSEHPHYQVLPSATSERLPVAYTVSREVLALPLFGSLGQEGAHRVCDILCYIFGNARLHLPT